MTMEVENDGRPVVSLKRKELYKTHAETTMVKINRAGSFCNDVELGQ